MAENAGEPTDEDRADALFHALADRTRRDILRRVLAGEHSVSALAADYPMSFAAVQKHVAVLERAGLITKRRSGRESLASGDVEAVRAVGALLAELEVTSGTMTNRVTRLAERGWVRRLPNPKDGRGVIVELCEQGRRRVDWALEELLVSEGRLLEMMTPDQIDELGQLLKTVLTRQEKLDQDCG